LVAVDNKEEIVVEVFFAVAVDHMGSSKINTIKIKKNNIQTCCCTAYPLGGTWRCCC
jgi:hypothetical protein